MFNSFKELPAPCRIFITVIGVIGFSVLALEGTRLQASPALLFFLVLAAFTSTWRVHLTGKLGTLSVGFAIVYATLLILGSVEAVFAGAVSALPATIRSARTGKIQPLHRILYGVASISLTAWIAGYIYTISGGGKGITLQDLLIPVSISTAAYYFVNTILVAIPVALSGKEPILPTWRKLFLWTVPSYYAGTCCAVLMKILYDRAGLVTVFFMMPPLYIVLYSYRLYIDKMQQEMKHIERLSELYLSTVHSLVAAIDAKDRYTRDHSSRVQQYSVIVAEQMGLSKDDLEAIRTGGLLHDVGKLGVPDFILTKAGALTPDELRRVQEHPALGYEILKPLPFPWDVLPVVRSHHERYDGKGYPDGLAGEAIPLVARVLAVADVYDALTSERPYRKAWSHEKAVEYIRDSAGTQFDPHAVEAFLQVSETICQAKQASSPARASSDAQEAEPSRRSAMDRQVPVLEHITAAHQEVFALYEIAQVMGNALNLDETIQLVLQKIQHLAGPCCCAIFLVDPRQGELTAHDAIGPYADTVRRLRLIIGEGVTGQVVKQQRMMVGEGAAQDFQHLGEQSHPPFQSYISVPLFHNDEMLGALTCYHEQIQAFSRDMVQLLPIVAKHAAMALYNALTLEKTRQSSLTDHLTGLPNSRYLFMALEQEMERARRNHQPFSLVVIDLDDFKQVNDSYGHLAGDQVLKEFGSVLRSVGRPYDIVVRYAGDEYFVLLPQADTDVAHTWVSRLHKAVGEHPWILRLGHSVTVTISAGCAAFPYEAEDVHSLIQIADERMYAAKDTKKKNMLRLYPRMELLPPVRAEAQGGR